MRNGSALDFPSVLWPRYAREEFLKVGRAALKTVNQLVSAHAQASIDPANAPSETEKIRSTFDHSLNVVPGHGRDIQEARIRYDPIRPSSLRSRMELAHYTVIGNLNRKLGNGDESRASR